MAYLSKTKIIGFGAYLPETRLTNADLEMRVETSDEWIVQRTGMKERRIANENEYASDLAIKAVDDLISRHPVTVQDVDMIIVTTFTPDHFTPTVSALVQGHYRMPCTGTFDLGAGCTGFNYGLVVADSMITCGRCKKILLIAAETVSKVVDYDDRSTCILFGDASVACLLEYTEESGSFLGSYFSTDGEMAHSVTCGNHSDVVNGCPLKSKGVFEQDGRQVYKYVVQNVPNGIHHLLQTAGLSLDAVDWLVPHSANMRMIEAICEKLPFPLDQTLTSLEYYGNTSSATIPLSLWLAQNEAKIKSGDRLVLYGFGGGMTHGGVVVEL